MNQSIIEHKANYFYIEFREDYLEIARKWTYKKPVRDGQKSKGSDYCKALILSIMEHWTNTKRGQGEDLSIYMTYPQWTEAMYHMFSRSVIIDSLEELMGEQGKEGLIERSEYMLYGRNTFRYTLNCKLLNTLMHDLPDRDPHHTLPKTNEESEAALTNNDPSKSRRDTSKNISVASTNGRHPSKSRRDTNIQVDATHPNLDDDPSKSRHNIDSYTDSAHPQYTDSAEGTLPSAGALLQEGPSSIHSDNISFNSHGGVTAPPPGVEGVPATEPHDHDASPCLIPMAEVNSITQDTLLQWAREAKVGVPGDASRIAAAAAKLLPLVRSIDDVKRLKAIARTKHRGIIWLGNLCTDAVLAEWQAEPPQEIGMSKEELGVVLDALPASIPNSALQVFAVDEARTLFTLALFYGDGERDFYEITRSSDAPYVYGHPQIQEQCAAYGERLCSEAAI